MTIFVYYMQELEFHIVQIAGKKIEKQSIDQIVDTIMELEEGTKIQVLSPVIHGRKGEFIKL